MDHLLAPCDHPRKFCAGVPACGASVPQHRRKTLFGRGALKAAGRDNMGRRQEGSEAAERKGGGAAKKGATEEGTKRAASRGAHQQTFALRDYVPELLRKNWEQLS